MNRPTHQRCSPARSAVRGGFTLIELLMVLIVIAWPYSVTVFLDAPSNIDPSTIKIDVAHDTGFGLVNPLSVKKQIEAMIREHHGQ